LFLFGLHAQDGKFGPHGWSTSAGGGHYLCGGLHTRPRHEWDTAPGFSFPRRPKGRKPKNKSEKKKVIHISTAFHKRKRSKKKSYYDDTLFFSNPPLRETYKA
jgi:hypothetical protein